MSHSQLNFYIFAIFVVLGVGSIMGPLILIGEQNFEKMKRNANAKIDILLCSIFLYNNIHTFLFKKNSFGQIWSIYLFFIFQSISNLTRSFQCSASLEMNIFKVTSNQKSTQHFLPQQNCTRSCKRSKTLFNLTIRGL